MLLIDLEAEWNTDLKNKNVEAENQVPRATKFPFHSDLKKIWDWLPCLTNCKSISFSLVLTEIMQKEEKSL